MDKDNAQLVDPIQPTIPEDIDYLIEEDYVIVDEFDPGASFTSQSTDNSEGPSAGTSARVTKRLSAELFNVAKVASGLWNGCVKSKELTANEQISPSDEARPSRPSHDLPVRNASDLGKLTQEELLEHLRAYLPEWRASESDDMELLRQRLLHAIALGGQN